ncbi:MAG TPA: bifunctional YncE family protein/alkaline phosphatase family protein [Vicinamibacterales bacterium]|nr:bifunctional YncE family protein/alkaline phosphatase family protein [Vicinamibacterales bacterium]
MKRVACTLLLVMALGGTWRAVDSYRARHPVSGTEITVPGRNGPNALLVSGWKTTPAGRQLASGDMILSGQVSPDGKLFAFVNTGYTRHNLHIVDLATEKEIATFPMEQAWSGLAFSPDGSRIFVSSGAGYPGHDIAYFDRWDKDGWQEARSGYTLVGAVKEKTAVSSINVSRDGKLLYALNNSDDHLYILETHGGRALARVNVGDHPLAAKLSRNGETLYVANLGSANVAVVDVKDPNRPTVTSMLATDPHPNDLAITDDGRLFVSCGHTNNVIAFDLGTSQRLEVISTALGPKAPAGSTPNSLALSPDQKTLFVANADNNSVSVIDVQERGRARPLGFLPTGWYPTLVRTTADGKRILVASGKGAGTGPSRVKRPIDPIAPTPSFQHHGNQLNGLVSFIDTPDAKALAGLTKQVYDNALYRDALLETSGASGASVIPIKVGESSPIKHVLFIMKENRTYDQVFGDLRQGNGDPSLTLFGRDVTPNQHALAEQFVLLDNLYCSGEVSQDGQPWTTSAYVNEFTQRAWTLSYSRHGSVDTEDRIGEQSTPYIWELAKQKGLRVRTYGMGNRRGVADVRSVRYDQTPIEPGQQRPRDTERAARFIEEFVQMDRDGTVPNFMFMSLGENHTNGTAPGSYTPKAMVASNDLAVGRIVETITKSKVWPEFAIFIIEDDAQNGPDHVDSHRTAGLVISPYVKRKVVDSTMYSTVSMLRTVELLLGLPPMTQHDAAAPPMVNSFRAKPDLTGFSVVDAQTDLLSKNPAQGYGAALSARMDFREYDRIDEDVLNRILWHGIKGVDAPYPAPVRRALPTPYGLFTFPNDLD